MFEPCLPAASSAPVAAVLLHTYTHIYIYIIFSGAAVLFAIFESFTFSRRNTLLLLESYFSLQYTQFFLSHMLIEFILVSITIAKRLVG